MGNQPRRHHFVPQFLIRQFAGPNRLVWYYDKDEPDAGIVQRNPAKVLQRPHYYSQRKSDQVQRDTSQEQLYSQLEGRAKPVISLITTNIRDGTMPRLAPPAKSTWDEFLYEQFRRVPDFRATVLGEERAEELVEQSIGEFELQNGRPLATEDRERLLDHDNAEQLRHNAHVAALGRSSVKVMRTLKDRGLAIARTLSDRDALVLGSRPVVKLTPPGTKDLSDHRVEMWLPIAPDIAVGVGLAAGTEAIILLTSAMVAMLNVGVAQQSSELVARDRATLESLLALAKVRD